MAELNKRFPYFFFDGVEEGKNQTFEKVVQKVCGHRKAYRANEEKPARVYCLLLKVRENGEFPRCNRENCPKMKEMEG